MAERRRPGSRRATQTAGVRTRPAKKTRSARTKAAGAKAASAKAKKAAGKARAKKAANKRTADPHAAVRRYRERMRAKGLRPVTIWVPDLKNPDVLRRLQEGIAAVAEHERTSPRAREDAAFWEKVAEEAWEDLPDYDWGPDGPPKG